MKELVLVYSSSTPSCKKMLANEDFVFSINELRAVVTIKVIRVDDEYTRQVLLRVGKPRVPFMIIDSGGEFQEVRGVSNIFKAITDMRNLTDVGPKKEPGPEVLERLRENVYWVSCANYGKLGKKLQAFIVFVHDDCGMSVSSYSTEKIAEMIISGNAQAKYLVVAVDKQTAEQCCKPPIAITGKSTVERLAAEYKEQQHNFLAKK